MRTLAATLLVMAITLALGCAGQEPAPVPTSAPQPTRIPRNEPLWVPPEPGRLQITPPTPAVPAQPVVRTLTRRGEELQEDAALAFDEGVWSLDDGETLEARDSFLEALRLNGKPSRLPLVHLGRARQELGDHPGALEAFTEAIRREDGADARTRRAVSHLETGNCLEAIRDAQQALGMQPETQPGWFHTGAEAGLVMASCQRERGNTGWALRYARAALDTALGAGYGGEPDRFSSLVEELEREAAILPIPETTPEAGPTPAPETTPETTPEAPTPAPAPEPTMTAGPPARMPDVTAPPSVIAELEKTGNYRLLRRNRPEAARAVERLPMVADGLEPPETELLGALTRLLLRRGTRDFLPALQHPFLWRDDQGDLEALEALTRIREKSREDFRRIMEHSGVAREGITDEMTPVIAVMPGVLRMRPGLTEALLDGGGALVENREIIVRRTGPVRLAIVGLPGRETNPGAMEYLERAVRETTILMEEPFPKRMAALLVTEMPEGEAIGANFGSGIILDAGLEMERTGRLAGAIAHEVSHHYWQGNEPWVDEGMADLTAASLESGRTGRTLSITRFPCWEYGGLAELPARETAHQCDYSLGSRLFMDLRLSLGKGTFWNEIRRLRQKTGGNGLGVEELREHFGDHAHEGERGEPEGEAHSHGGEALRRFHDGEGPFRGDPLADRRVEPDLMTIPVKIDSVDLLLDGTPVQALGSQTKEGRVKLRITYLHDPRERDGEFGLEILTIHEDGIPIGGPRVTLPARAGVIGGVFLMNTGPPEGQRWKPGAYQTHVLEGDRKVGEVAWEVVD